MQKFAALRIHDAGENTCIGERLHDVGENNRIGHGYMMQVKTPASATPVAPVRPGQKKHLNKKGLKLAPQFHAL
jgi:hypothetical protein